VVSKERRELVKFRRAVVMVVDGPDFVLRRRSSIISSRSKSSAHRGRLSMRLVRRFESMTDSAEMWPEKHVHSCSRHFRLQRLLALT
jgi:hypothetical protein